MDDSVASGAAPAMSRAWLHGVRLQYVRSRSSWDRNDSGHPATGRATVGSRGCSTIKFWPALTLLRNRLPVLVQTRAQFARVGLSRRFTCGDGDIDRRQGVLIQTEGFSCEALDSIARDRGA